MEYVAGVVLALGTSLLASTVGLDRARAFYPTGMIVIASYYGLFAVMGGLESRHYADAHLALCDEAAMEIHATTSAAARGASSATTEGE